MGPAWGSSGFKRAQVGPMLAPWILLSGYALKILTLHIVVNANEKSNTWSGNIILYHIMELVLEYIISRYSQGISCKNSIAHPLRGLVLGDHGQRRSVLMFSSLICAWAYGQAKNRDASDLRRHGADYDVPVMRWISFGMTIISMA